MAVRMAPTGPTMGRCRERFPVDGQRPDPHARVIRGTRAVPVLRPRAGLSTGRVGIRLPQEDTATLSRGRGTQNQMARAPGFVYGDTCDHLLIICMKTGYVEK